MFACVHTVLLNDATFVLMTRLVQAPRIVQEDVPWSREENQRDCIFSQLKAAECSNTFTGHKVFCEYSSLLGRWRDGLDCILRWFAEVA